VKGKGNLGVIVGKADFFKKEELQVTAKMTKGEKENRCTCFGWSASFRE
jgi:hypothetical protein